MKLTIIKLVKVNLYKAMKSWSDASTIILTAPQKLERIEDKSTPDFDVLMLKRSNKSSFYPNAFVFPGGRIDKADCLQKWMDLYQSVDGRFLNFFKNLKVNQDDGQRPPMLINSSTNSMLKEVSYRICAIRETFEETGILLTRDNINQLDSTSNISLGQPYEFKNDNIARSWRKRVHDDANQFIELCAQLKQVPDVWSLHEWSNWLTPTEMLTKLSRRFDTVFYTVSLKRLPSYSEHDNVETTKMIFKTPAEILRSFCDNSVYLGPPQLYELSRMLNFTSHEEFIKFSSERGMKGMERWLPVRAETTDNTDMMLSLYPGDQWYPQEDAESGDLGKITIPMTYDEMLKVEPKCHNHMRFQGHSRVDIVASHVPPYGHIAPKSIAFDVNSKYMQKL